MGKLEISARSDDCKVLSLGGKGWRVLRKLNRMDFNTHVTEVFSCPRWPGHGPAVPTLHQLPVFSPSALDFSLSSLAVACFTHLWVFDDPFPWMSIF